MQGGFRVLGLRAYAVLGVFVSADPTRTRLGEREMHLALIIGHSRSAQGAISVGGVTEHRYNRGLADQIVAALRLGGSGLRVTIVERTGTYSQLPGRVNAIKADFAIELHFNAHVRLDASGTEMLYWHTSQDGMRLAGILQEAVLGTLGLRDRGLKAISSEGARGGLLLRRTHMPCVIAEPFFGSNEDDWDVAERRKTDLATAYAQAIQRYAGEAVTAVPPITKLEGRPPKHI